MNKASHVETWFEEIGIMNCFYIKLWENSSTFLAAYVKVATVYYLN